MSLLGINSSLKIVRPPLSTENNYLTPPAAVDETHLLVKTDMLDEVKAEFQAQVRPPSPSPSPLPSRRRLILYGGSSRNSHSKRRSRRNRETQSRNSGEAARWAAGGGGAAGVLHRGCKGRADGIHASTCRRSRNVPHNQETSHQSCISDQEIRTRRYIRSSPREGVRSCSTRSPRSTEATAFPKEEDAAARHTLEWHGSVPAPVGHAASGTTSGAAVHRATGLDITAECLSPSVTEGGEASLRDGSSWLRGLSGQWASPR